MPRVSQKRSVGTSTSASAFAAKRVLVLFVVFSFFSAYFTPELIHSAAHVISQTTHAASLSDASHASGQGTACELSKLSSERCAFAAFLNAHAGHAFSSPASRVESKAADFNLHFAVLNRTLSSRLAHVLFQARGPPAAVSFAIFS